VIVYVYPGDLAGCGYYRLTWASQILRKAGHDVRIIHPSKTKLSGNTDANGQLTGIVAPKDADVMVFQRVTSVMMINGINILRQHGIAVVLDIDDDMSAIHPNNPAFAPLQPGGAQPEYNFNNARKVADAATLVTVSSDALLRRYAVHGRGRILRNCIPQAVLDIERNPEDPRVIGWGGGMHAHPDDPQVVGLAMTRLTRLGYKFRVVGPPRGVKSAFKLDDEPLSDGPVPIEKYHRELSRRLQVGIAPLNDTRFNEAKSWLKMLEYAALGIPCVGSPRAEYRRLHDLGVGLLADNPKQWFRHCKALMENADLRDEVAGRGREAAAKLTLEGNAWRWWEAWTDAYEIQRGSSTGAKSAVTTVPATP
jgi:hypothetical protein